MQRYFVLDKKDNLLALDPHDVHHICHVMRYSVGKRIECVYQEEVFLCEIVDLKSPWVKIIQPIEVIRSKKSSVSVAIGMVKEQKMDLILQKLTELGIDEIIPVVMERSIVRLEPERVDKKLIRWNKICKEASEQSKRNTIPLVHFPISVLELSKLSYEKKFLCSTNLNQKMDYHYLQQFQNCATMIFVIGPEGGITDREEDLLQSAGYSSVSFGNEIMRVETAAIYVASITRFMK